jgi:hypothetical protein
MSLLSMQEVTPRSVQDEVEGPPPHAGTCDGAQEYFVLRE